ncbi:MAG: M1 family aminopeptidase [Chitinophagales bacterium]
MRKYCLFLVALLVLISLDAKPKKKRGDKKFPKILEEVVVAPKNLITSYKGSETKYFDLLHTKLNIKPIFNKKELVGTAELLIRPHFYNQNKVVLDAKYMQIHSVAVKKNSKNLPLTFVYDTTQLTITLDTIYTRFDSLTLLINYTATPYQQDSLQVDDGRGMYFIDVEDKNPYKPMHLWTQGEEESNSCWFPTFDATNQKSSEEIYVTIDKNLTSLSNGLLISSKDNGDGTKTDYWKQDKPHSPYLFFLAVGDFYKSVDHWRDKEVSAYTFPKYKDAVAEIFKNMPEMMEFFSNKLGVDFPWDKMANVMAFDYTAGAMENTSAIIYYDRLLCDRQQLVDGDFDWIISHELFHQWFGDLVTAESWANLTLNESFADFSEALWTEYKYGQTEAEIYRNKSMGKYLYSSHVYDEPIMNYYYNHPHDLFDNIRYEKGGIVLNMLRNYVGDEAFFLSLHKYLNEHKFGNAELSDLRKTFEEVTGKDLNWFFTQWWNEKGFPVLNITHKYDATNKTIALTIQQTQKGTAIFRIPTKVNIYINGKIETKIIEITDKTNTFYFPAATAPQFVNFDADKVLLCEKTEDLSEAENIFKYYNAPKTKDKLEAIEALAPKLKGNSAIQNVFYDALQNKNWYIRLNAINLLKVNRFSNSQKLSTALQNTIQTDTNPEVREKALNKYVQLEREKSIPLCEKIIRTDSSYSVIANALTHLNTYDKNKAYTEAVKWNSTESRRIIVALCNIYKDTTADQMEFFKKAIWLNTPYTFYPNFKSFSQYLTNVNLNDLEKGILFLSDIYTYEESNYNKDGAKQAIQNLKSYFAEKAKKDKQADLKLQVVKKVGRAVL